MSTEPAREARTEGRALDFGDRLRDARRNAGLSLRELARRIGVSASLISQIENDKVQPSVNTLYALASELGISIDELLFNESRPVNGPVDGLSPIQRAGSRKVIHLDSGVRWERLTTTSEPGFDFLYIVYGPGGESAAPGKLHRHTGREWGYVAKGTLHIQLGFDEYVLETGDSITYDSTTPHRLYNPGPEAMHGVWFVLGRHEEPPGLD